MYFIMVSLLLFYDVICPKYDTNRTSSMIYPSDEKFDDDDDDEPVLPSISKHFTKCSTNSIF